MCTCIQIKNKYTYFGRNLDLDYSFNEKIIITPRNFILKFKKYKNINSHYAFIGIGTIIDNYPLYAEATNEYGLSIAGLNFPSNCYYYKKNKSKINIAPYELTLYLLGLCKNIKEVKMLLKDINIMNLDFSKDVQLTPLHFMISDKNESIVLETLKDGMKIYDNPFNVLTNNPPFYYHKENIINYMNLHNKDAINNLNRNLNLEPYSFGQGAIGLPGDFSSSSRFIKSFFTKNFLLLDKEENNNIIQFFKCLESVSMINGNVKTKSGYEYTRYSSCINVNKGILYYKTYYNPNIYSINMYKENLDLNYLIDYELINKYQIFCQN